MASDWLPSCEFGYGNIGNASHAHAREGHFKITDHKKYPRNFFSF